MLTKLVATFLLIVVVGQISPGVAGLLILLLILALLS